MSSTLPDSPVTPISRFPTPLAVLELLKPVTWFPPMWAFACGAVSSGVALGANWVLVLVGVVLAGPIVCGMSQAINDWHDRHVDAINEPNRVIPSGRMPGKWGLHVAMIMSFIAIFVAAPLGKWVLIATLLGLVLALMYSAPPFRLKLNGWWGNAAVAFSYEGLAWFTGAAALLGAFPDWKIVTLAALYAAGAHGIMTLNDFKAVEGDRQMGVRSLPVQLGTYTAAKLAAWVMAIPQVIVIALLFAWDRPVHGGIIAASLLVQIWLMRRYLYDRDRLDREPHRVGAMYNATGVSLSVLGMMIAAVAVRGLV